MKKTIIMDGRPIRTFRRNVDDWAALGKHLQKLSEAATTAMALSTDKYLRMVKGKYPTAVEGFAETVRDKDVNSVLADYDYERNEVLSYLSEIALPPTKDELAEGLIMTKGEWEEASYLPPAQLLEV